MRIFSVKGVRTFFWGGFSFKFFLNVSQVKKKTPFNHEYSSTVFLELLQKSLVFNSLLFKII